MSHATLCTVDKKDARLTRRMIVMDEVKGTLCTVDKKDDRDG